MHGLDIKTVGTQSMSDEGREGKKKERTLKTKKRKQCPGAQGQHTALTTLYELRIYLGKTVYIQLKFL